jgi:hypothetical protein
VADEFEFEPRLGAMGASQTFLGSVLREAARKGRVSRAHAGRGHFDGSRIGRGAGVGRVLRTSHGGTETPPFAWVGTRRTVVLTRIAYNRAGNGRPAAAHLLYLERPGVARDAGPTKLYDQTNDVADRRRFVEQSKEDRHHFRIVVSPEDGAEYEDLKPFIRRFMTQVSQDLRTDLDWVAADHYDTALPHSHIVVRGRDGDNNDLIIAREYVEYGLPIRAAELLALDLGPRSAETICRARKSMLREERFTPLDAALVSAVDPEGLVSALHDDLWQQSQRTGRLRILQQMSLAKPVGRGRWQLASDLPQLLSAMSAKDERTVAKTVSRDLLAHHEAGRNRISDEKEQPLIGSVIVTYAAIAEAPGAVTIDASDGQIHHITVANSLMRVGELPPQGALVAIQVERTAGAFEADSRQRSDAVFALSLTDDTVLAPNDRAVAVAVLSERPLETMPGYDGPTWLDRELMATDRLDLGTGFGADIARALERRRLWLLDQNLAEERDGITVVQADLLNVLEARELRREGLVWAQMLGVTFASEAPTESTERHRVPPASLGTVNHQQNAIVRNEFAFNMVPWSPSGPENGRVAWWPSSDGGGLPAMAGDGRQL